MFPTLYQSLPILIPNSSNSSYSPGRWVSKPLPYRGKQTLSYTTILLTKTRINILSKYNLEKKKKPFPIKSRGKETLYANLPFLSKSHYSPHQCYLKEHAISYIMFQRLSLVIGTTLLPTLGCTHPSSKVNILIISSPNVCLLPTLSKFKGD